MPPGIANTLDILVAQAEAQAETIRNLMKLCREVGIPEFRIAKAVQPLVESPHNQEDMPHGA